MLKITGYSDEISVRPGETISFMISSEMSSYQADIVRLICGDTNPEGPGYKEELVETSVSKSYREDIRRFMLGLTQLSRTTPCWIVWRASPFKP